MEPVASNAVFLSYASQDSEPARRIADALQASEVEVWFDQSELRGGDAWDARIKRQIKECALFIPVISANTRARSEGYFRREWKLAVERTHDMAEDVAFFVPVIIDDTADAHARVPEKFHEVQWTRLPGGETPSTFCTRVQSLLAGESVAGCPATFSPARSKTTRRAPASSWRGLLALAAATILALIGWQAWHRLGFPESKATSATPPVAIQPPEVQNYVAQVRKIIAEYEHGMLARQYLELADQLVQKALQLEPADAEAWALASQVSQGIYAQNYDRSLARRDAIDSQAARAVKLAPDLPDAQFAYGTALAIDASTLPEAERILGRLVERFPKEWRYSGALATVLNLAGKREESLAMKERASRLAGDDPMALLLKSEALATRGLSAKAEQALDLFLTRQPTEAGYLRKFQLLFERGDVEAMRRALSEMPPVLLRNDNVANWAAAIWLGSRNAKQAREVLQAAPGDYFSVNYWEGPKAYFEALTYAMEGSRDAARAKWEDALRVIDKRLAQEPNRSTLLFLKADILGRLDRKPEAEQVARVFQQLAGSDQPTWLTRLRPLASVSRFSRWV